MLLAAVFPATSYRSELYAERCRAEREHQEVGRTDQRHQVRMLTTVEPDGSLRSRPMATQQVEFDGDLWFFTGASMHKVYDIENNPPCNVAFSDPNDQNYVSMSGRAALVRDKQKAKDLWNVFYRSWFPQGLDDPDLALLRVEVDGAEYNIGTRRRAL